ncbi:MAG: Rrf2 family transcriptional regulator [Gemmatimonadetes bacterium]|jgi:Rrf2 family protein|nr:Rrf2 family transcriptional regulator [Gemmatimonadota bacterium]MBP6671480.1 Rrf2 family transcriptional regulator [Gemmatimonadales bacterium]MBK7716195.1 Rrf2 family transcriptional regulator [Gemmatimonadota bacterium]MBK7785429.1 Rrf2 family transcriptional regulator [Gemmatimonadota bacterium]MBK7923691.1 Rrf2 family transcriptional regulator [Gemmatimonadota bacterium]
MRITTWTEYSLIISIHLARRGAAGSGPVAAREIAEQERLPGDYVEQILLRLRRAGLVESVRGAKGGYYLAKDPAAISMRDIMTASEHQTFEMNCATHQVDNDRCNPGAACSIRPVWQALQQRVDDLLGGIALADLMKHETQVQELVSIAPTV